MKRKRKDGDLEVRKIKRRNVDDTINASSKGSKMFDTPEIHILENKTWANYKMIQTIIFNSFVENIDPKWLLMVNRSRIQNIVVVNLNMVSYEKFIKFPIVVQRKKQENPQGDKSIKPKHLYQQKYFKHKKSEKQALATHLRSLNKDYFNRFLHQFGFHKNTRGFEQKKIKRAIDDGFSNKMEQDGNKMLKTLEALRLSIDDLIGLDFPMDEDSFDMQSRDCKTRPEIKSLDCEMVKTINDRLEIARVTLIRFDESVIIDTFVVPDNPISDYNTKYSGITKDMLDGVKVKLADVQKMLVSKLSSEDFLVGHSLENDLKALRFHHTNVIDTSVLFPHSEGLPYKNSLRFLCQKYLKRKIQNDSKRGHDSVEDSVAALDLVKLKINNPELGNFTQKIANGMKDQSLLHQICKFCAPKNVKCYVLDSSNLFGVKPLPGKVHVFKCANDEEVFNMSVKQIRENEKENERTVSWINFNELAELYLENAQKKNQKQSPSEQKDETQTNEPKKKKKRRKKKKKKGVKVEVENKIVKKLANYTSGIINCVPRNTIVMIISPHGNLKNVGNPKWKKLNLKDHYDTTKGFLYTFTKK